MRAKRRDDLKSFETESLGSQCGQLSDNIVVGQEWLFLSISFVVFTFRIVAFFSFECELDIYGLVSVFVIQHFTESIDIIHDKTILLYCT